jgi:hypothetical protein
MKPFLGASVICVGIPSNGSSEHAAIVTRAWDSKNTFDGPVTVNLTVFPDCAEPTCRSSVMLFLTAGQARSHIEKYSGGVAAYWPAGA